MRLTSESASQIAERISQNPAEIRTLLDSMVKKGLIRASGNEEQRKFGLMPFVVGIYEAQLGRLDKETALQFENLYQAFAEQVLSHSPSLHKVIPVEKSIPVEVQVFPYEQASALLEKAKSFGVLKCICRVQKSLIGEPCKYPTEICLAFSPVEESFDNNPIIKAINKEEALQLLQKAEDAGLYVGLKRKIEAMEKKYNRQFQIVFEAIKKLLEPSAAERKRKIGFHAD